MPRLIRCFLVGAPVALFVLGAFAAAARGQLPSPQLKTISPLGGQIGSTFEVTIGGDDLDDVRELRFSQAGITAEPKMHQPSEFDEPQPVGNQFVVQVANDVPPGLVEVRAVGYFGVSNPRMLAVDRLREVAAGSDATSLTGAAPLGVGTAVTAVASSERVQYYKVHVAAGQKVLIECLAERLDSLMDATLVLFDAAGTELARVRDTIGRDPAILLAPQEDQTFVVGVYDFTFRGGNEYFYRLAAHTEPRLVYAFPPVVQSGPDPRKFSLFGWNLPGGETVDAGASFAAAPLQRLDVEATLEGPSVAPAATQARAALAVGVPYRFSGPRGPTNPVIIQTAPHPVVAENRENDTPERAESMPVSGEFVGRIERPGDRDWIEFAGNRGDELHLDVIADRMGVAADVVIAVHMVSIREDGMTETRPIATVDDRPYGRDDRFDISSSDPAERIVVDEPAIFRIEVRDLYGNPTGDARLAYRLSVRRDAPDFRLTAIVEPPRGADNQPLPIGTLSLRRGSDAALVVCAHRLGGFDGPIEVSAQGLPPQVSCRPALIRPGEDRTTLVVSAAVGAPPWSARIDIAGRTQLPERTIEHLAIGGTMTWPAGAPNIRPEARLCRSIELAVSGSPPSPAKLRIDEQVVTTCVGGKIKVPIRVDRQEGFAADVNVTPVGLVDGLLFNAAAIAKDANETEAELFVSQGGFAPGEYEFHVTSRIRANLPRNPDAIARALGRKTRFDELFAAKTSDVEGVSAARDATNTTMQTAASVLADREAELAAARAEAEKSVANQEAVVSRLAAAREGLSTTVTSAESAPALRQVQQEVMAAIEAARAARTRVVDLEAARASAQAAADVGTTQLAIAERELQAATEARSKLEPLRDEANKQLEVAQQAHGPRDFELELISQPVRVVVEDAPIAIDVQSESETILQGGDVKLAVRIERKFGFDGVVELRLVAPEGLAVEAPTISVASDSDTGVIEVRTRPETPPGRHACELEASMQLNGVHITKRIPLALTISPATQP